MNAHILCSITVFRKPCRCDVGKYCRHTQATEGSIIRPRKDAIAYRVTEARILTHTHTHNTVIFFVFYGNNGYANAPQLHHTCTACLGKASFYVDNRHITRDTKVFGTYWIFIHLSRKVTYPD
jgi:hypothetical protein